MNRTTSLWIRALVCASLLTTALLPSAVASHHTDAILPTVDDQLPAVDFPHCTGEATNKDGLLGIDHPVMGNESPDDDGEDADRCPPPTANGASCVSHGVLIMERDLTGGYIGDATAAFSTSRAWTLADEGKWDDGTVATGQAIAPPADPQAHADAQQAGAAYDNAATGLGVSASTVYSQCDVAAIIGEPGLYTEAYGRGGVEDLEITYFGTPVLGAEVLDFEVDAVGTPGHTAAHARCDIVSVSPPLGSACVAPNTGGSVTVLSVNWNEQWGPQTNSAGQHVYGGAALHVSLWTGATIVDVYVGYAAVAVTGGSAAPLA